MRVVQPTLGLAVLIRQPTGKSMLKSNGLRSEIAEKMSLDLIRYSQVWEDHKLLEAGLAIDTDDDVLSICSAGCNALAMLLCEPRSVTAIDMNPSQIALLELKIAGIAELNHDAFVCLLGVRDHQTHLRYITRFGRNYHL